MTRILWIVVGVFCYAGAVAADSVVLMPAKDNTLIQRTDPLAQLSNGTGDIYVGRTNQDGQDLATISIRRGLIAFALDGKIPAGSTITSVTLTMRDVRGLNGDHVTTLHRVTQDWGEGTSFFSGGQGAAATENDATWLYTFFNSADPSASPAWDTPGGDFLSTASASTMIAVITDPEADGQLVSWSSSENPQMIVDVQDWLDDPTNNFGWLIRGNESAGQTAKRLNSSESMTFPDVAPTLTVIYLVPEPSSVILACTAAWGVIAMRKPHRRRFL